MEETSMNEAATRLTTDPDAPQRLRRALALGGELERGLRALALVLDAAETDRGAARFCLSALTATAQALAAEVAAVNRGAAHIAAGLAPPPPARRGGAAD
jgi:hypothetical protein